jgi:riboflavin biosynthesis pyrimidine reductase
MVTTIDGRAAIGGSSRELGGEADLQMLVALRRWAQVLVVGSGTVRAEGYGKIRRDLLVVVVSRSGRFPLEAPLFAAEEQPVETSTSDPVSLIESLRSRGLTRVLCEGGPTLLRAWVEAGVLDELFLTVDPVLTADAEQPRILSGPALPAPLRATLVWAVPQAGELFLRFSLREKTH